jgi:hypothetical protein
MAEAPHYWDSVRECRELVAGLILRTEEWIKRLPEMNRLFALQERAKARTNILLGVPGIERRRERAKILYDGRVARFTKIWNAKGAFYQEAQTQFERLSTVLTDYEVERMKARVNWADLQSILSNLKGAAKRLDEFWEARPEQNEATSDTRAEDNSTSRQSTTSHHESCDDNAAGPGTASDEPVEMPSTATSRTATDQNEAAAFTRSQFEASRAAARKKVVMPILTQKRWSPGKWATIAGVGKNSVYEYLNGKRSLTKNNREAMAQVLGLRAEDLPE